MTTKVFTPQEIEAAGIIAKEVARGAKNGRSPAEVASSVAARIPGRPTGGLDTLLVNLGECVDVCRTCNRKRDVDPNAFINSISELENAFSEIKKNAREAVRTCQKFAKQSADNDELRKQVEALKARLGEA